MVDKSAVVVWARVLAWVPVWAGEGVEVLGKAKQIYFRMSLKFLTDKLYFGHILGVTAITVALGMTASVIKICKNWIFLCMYHAFFDKNQIVLSEARCIFMAKS